MIAIDRRTLLAAVAAAGALPAPAAFSRATGELLDMTSTYPHYAAAIGFGRARCDGPELETADRAFGA